MLMRRLATLFAVSLVTCWLAVSSFADSQARIVRLSQVDGAVQIDRNTGQGFEKAFLNLPITQGTKIRTGADSRAEIEFEDGTTLRLTPNTAVEFPELARRDSGGRSSNLELQGGTAYLNFKGDKQEQFRLNFGQEKLTLTKQAHLRIEMKDANATVAVFKGEVDVDGSSGKVNVEKKHSATFDLAGASPYTLANSLEPDPYDQWDKQQDQYQQRYSASNSFSPYSYGTSDMNYYGSFYTVPGYGMMWQPFLIGAGLGSIHERRLELVSRSWIYVGVFLSLGLDALSLRFLDLSVGLRLVLAARKHLGGMEHRSANRQCPRKLQRSAAAFRSWTDFGGEPRWRFRPRPGGAESIGSEVSDPRRFRRAGSRARKRS